MYTHLTLIFLALTLLVKSQQVEFKKFYDYKFDNDSLKGFDESAAKFAAISEGLVGDELKVKLFLLKRSYINDVYGLKVNKTQFIEQTGHTTSLSKSASMAGNEDFESSPDGLITSSTQIAGWEIVSGNYSLNIGSNSCNLLGCCPSNPSKSRLISSQGYVDPVIGSVYPIYSVFGQTLTNSSVNYKGNNFLRINSYNGVGGIIEMASKTLSVGVNDSLFSYAFICVLTGIHQCCEGTSIHVKVTDLSNNTLVTNSTCQFYGQFTPCTSQAECLDFYYVISGAKASASSNGSFFSKWRINNFNLKGYVGRQLRFDFIASCCIYGGHSAYMYLDAAMNDNSQANRLIVDNRNYLLGKDTTQITVCNTPATLEFPLNFNSIKTAPNLVSVANPFYANTGVYTVVTSYDNCSGLSKDYVIKINKYVGPKVISFNPIICAGEKAVLGVSGVSNFLWNTGEKTANIIVSPTVTTTYYAKSTSKEGCSVGTTPIVQYVDQCTGIQSLNTSSGSFQVFHNQKEGELVVKQSSKNHKLVLINSLGEKVYEEVIEIPEKRMSTRQFSSGVYFYFLFSDDVVVARGKIINQN